MEPNILKLPDHWEKVMSGKPVGYMDYINPISALGYRGVYLYEYWCEILVGTRETLHTMDFLQFQPRLPLKHLIQGMDHYEWLVYGQITIIPKSELFKV